MYASVKVHCAAEMHMNTERVEHGGLNGERLGCALFVRGVGDVHVIGAVAGHE